MAPLRVKTLLPDFVREPVPARVAETLPLVGVT